MGRSNSLPARARNPSEHVELVGSCPRAVILGAALSVLTHCEGPNQIPIGAATGATTTMTTFFISPAGTDGGLGTRAQPWRTFAWAIPRLVPGATLVLLDGTYEGTTSGYPDIRCGTNAANGTADHPITLRADNERAALLKGDASGPPFFMQGCSFWTVEGLHAESGDFPNAPAGAAGGSLFVLDTNNANVVLRRLIGAHPNRYRDSLGLYVGDGSSNVLVEECEIYDFHFHAFEASHTMGVEFRRNYVNSRNTADIAAGFVTLDPARGDHALHLWETQFAVAENNVVESVRNGYVVKGGDTTSGSIEGNRLLGNVVLNPALSGFLLDSQCENKTPCLDRLLFVDGTELTDDVTIGGTTGILSTGTVNTAVNQFSTIGSGSGMLMQKAAYNVGVAATSSTVNSLALDFTVVGFSSSGETSWEFDHCAATSASGAVPFSPAASPNVTSTVALDPAMGACLVYLPAASPLRGAGAGARDVGAEVVYRYEGGLLTTARLWDAVTGAFPCGATVPGLNDDPTQSCIGVHQRLHVGAGGCPLP